MPIKITISPEFEKRHFHSNRLLLILMNKKRTASSDIFLTLCGYVPKCLIKNARRSALRISAQGFNGIIFCFVCAYALYKSDDISHVIL